MNSTSPVTAEAGKRPAHVAWQKKVVPVDQERQPENAVLQVMHNASLSVLYFNYFFMTKNITLFTIITVGIIGLAGCSNVIEKAQNPTPEKQKTVSEVQTTNIEQEPIKKAIAESDQTPVFTSFTQERYSELLGKKPFVLFFHASWCSTCTQLTKEINNDLANFPNGTMILKADFDTETKLKQDYGIVMQATLVVINKTGKAVQTLAAPSAEELKKAIAQTL